MFQSIRNFFRDAFFGKDELPSAVWHNGQKYIVYEWPSLPGGFTNKTEILSQAELQMLQRIVADAVFEQEQYWKGAKYDAQLHPVGDEERNFWFKQARKHQAKLKKLSALQYRLKHKIAARG